MGASAEGCRTTSSAPRRPGGRRAILPAVAVTDAHIHVQPWWELKPEVLDVMTRGREDVAELQAIMKSPQQLLRRLDADGIARAVLVNYPSPDLMGFTHRVNEYVAEYCQAAPDRLIPM